MLNYGQKVTIELIGNEKKKEFVNVTNPMINDDNSNTDKLLVMISNILEQEIPRLKNNPLLFNLVKYSVLEKLNTVQSVENVLSYIKETNAKTIEDVSFEKGEVRIKCSI